MGFYAPAQLVQDARRHAVEVRPVDVVASDRESSLERGPDGSPAVRLGLQQVRGLREAAAVRLVEARAQAAFADVADLAQRARLQRRDLETLASAGALANLGGHRHRARWAVAGLDAPLPLVAQGPHEAEPLLRRPSEGEDIVADYAGVGLTLRRHPLALLRTHLDRRGYGNAETLRELATDTRVRTAGLVVCRQHPSSASGVVFITIEDETGQTNIIVWPKLVERQRREVLQAGLLGVVGELQNEAGVIHLIARRLIDESALLGCLKTVSRDFR
jgi:error-prone DNA polymerase